MFTKIAACVGAIVFAVVVTGCGRGGGEPLRPPATITKIPGSAVERLELTGPAVRRLGLTTAAVRVVRIAVDGGAGPHEVIPYSAVVYDTNGSAWAYVSIAPRTYLRQPITIADIQGETVVLDRGPAVGALVVTTGAPELLGIEYNISGEQ